MTTDPVSTMQAIVQDGYGTPERVLRPDHIDRPQVGTDDVLVRVRATSVNTPDWATVAGVPYVLRLRSGLRRPSHPVRGSDVAGIVETVGRDVTDLRPGDEVLGSLRGSSIGSRAGTFAQYTIAPASQLRDVGGVGPGARVLINGASGGVGTMAVQTAKSLGAEVTGVCSTRNVELVRSLGADQVIDYTKQDFTQSQLRYDVILDNVMNHPPSATARLLAPHGVLIPNSIGTTGRLLGALPRTARATLMGRGANKVKLVTAAVNRENLNALVRLLESGEVRAVIDKTYPLDKAASAVAHMLGHHARGKVAITVS